MSATSHSTRFSPSSPTRSPGWMPASTSAAAHARTSVAVLRPGQVLVAAVALEPHGDLRPEPLRLPAVGLGEVAEVVIGPSLQGFIAPQTGASQSSRECSASSRSIASVIGRRHRRRPPHRHVHVRADGLRGRGQLVEFVDRHEVDRVPPLGGPAQDAAAEGDVLADAHFLQVAEVLGQGEAAGLVGREVLAGQADHLEQPPRALAEQVGVPHHVHVAHLVEIGLGDRRPGA